jgi:hypothetical protein
MDLWPELHLEEWRATYETVHRWVQILGKVRLALATPQNHWWHVALEVTPRGLCTGTTPYNGGDAFDLELDFIAHELVLRTSRGELKVFSLEARPVAEFYRDVMSMLRSVGIAPRIWDMPVEIPGATTPFHLDREHRAYDPEAVQRWHSTLLRVHEALNAFRGRFTGKSSPPLFWWGGADLSHTRFSGHLAAQYPDEPSFMAEAMCEEEFSVGFWPGTPGVIDAALFGYVSPAPRGFERASVRPAGAIFHPELREFVLPYEEVRRRPDPRAAMLEFMQSCYEAAAGLGGWDRPRLERPLKIGEAPAELGVPSPS